MNKDEVTLKMLLEKETPIETYIDKNGTERYTKEYVKYLGGLKN